MNNERDEELLEESDVRNKLEAYILSHGLGVASSLTETSGPYLMEMMIGERDFTRKVLRKLNLKRSKLYEQIPAYRMDENTEEMESWQGSLLD